MEENRRLFCFGFGYCAAYLTRRLTAKDWSVTGTSRTRHTPGTKALENIYLHRFDGKNPLDEIGRDALMESRAVLLSVPPTADGLDPAIELHYKDLLRSEKLKWIGYLSSTGVYGNHDGAWVDEKTSVVSRDARAALRIKIENQLLDLHKRYGLPIHIFRPSGIYGPGRSPLHRIMHGDGQIIHKKGHFFNRIHVEDIARVLDRSIHAPTPGEIFNLSDDEPASQEDVMNFAYQVVGKQAPDPVPYDQVEMSPMLQSFYAANKRVSNQKIKEKLSLELKYPTYRKGLTAISHPVED